MLKFDSDTQKIYNLNNQISGTCDHILFNDPNNSGQAQLIQANFNNQLNNERFSNMK